MLIIEDADSPTPHPLTHAVVMDLPPTDGGLAEGELKSPKHEGEGHDLGKNSYFKRQYLPPDPPPGHGEHRYVFQLFAVDTALADLERPSKDEIRKAIAGHVLSKGRLIGIYARP